MLETKNLILDKAEFSDWRSIYKNVWMHPESARYMMWSVTQCEEDAKERIKRTIEFQRSHDMYFVYEKSSGEAIGFAGVERIDDGVYQEMGICLGPDFVRKGYGREILMRLMKYCREEFDAKVFIYSTRSQNEASKRLALSLGFRLFAEEEKVDSRDNKPYILQKYRLELNMP